MKEGFLESNPGPQSGSFEWLFPVLRVLFGALFIASAILKLFPLEYFELVLVHQVGVAWELVPWFSRGLLILEFGLGAFLISGYRLKFSLWSSLGLLSAFQSFLIYQLLQGEGGANCGCFGELIPLDGPESIVKNIGFMLLGGALLLKIKQATKWSLAIVGPLLAVVSIPILFLLFPLPEFREDADFQLDIELLTRAPFEAESSLNEGDKTVILMLASCIHCAQLSSFIATLDAQDVENELRIIIVGGEGGVEYFVNETGIRDFEFVRSEDRELIGAIDGTFPTILFLEDGSVTKKWKGRDVNIRLLSELLGLD